MKKLINIIVFSLTIFNLLNGQIDLNKGLVAYYPFDGNTIDASINSNHGNRSRGTTLGMGCDGKDASAYFLNGVSSYLTFPHSNAINFGKSSAFSISLWLYVPEKQLDTESTGNDILSKWDNHGETPYPFVLRLTNQKDSIPGRVVFARYDSNSGGCSNSSAMRSSVTLNDNRWHNIIVQREFSGMMYMYIDGMMNDSTLDKSFCSTQNFSELIIGSRWTAYPLRVFKGGVDNLRIYNRTLSFAEIEAINNRKVSSVLRPGNHHDLIVFPNPAKDGYLQLANTSNAEMKGIELFGSSGKWVKSFPLNSTNINVSDIPSGLYFLKVRLENQNYFEKIIIQN